MVGILALSSEVIQRVIVTWGCRIIRNGVSIYSCFGKLRVRRPPRICTTCQGVIELGLILWHLTCSSSHSPRLFSFFRDMRKRHASDERVFQLLFAGYTLYPRYFLVVCVDF